MTTAQSTEITGGRTYLVSSRSFLSDIVGHTRSDHYFVARQWVRGTSDDIFKALVNSIARSGDKYMWNHRNTKLRMVSDDYEPGAIIEPRVISAHGIRFHISALTPHPIEISSELEEMTREVLDKSLRNAPSDQEDTDELRYCTEYSPFPSDEDIMSTSISNLQIHGRELDEMEIHRENWAQYHIDPQTIR